METTPWLDDACSLVDAFRSGDRSPVEELDACLTAIDASELNAFCHLDVDAARAAAAGADVQLPFGGLPVAVKELEPVAGWPYTEASLVFADRVADHDSTQIERLRAGGANLFGQTTASEFGGLNVSVTKLHGVTRNPWDKTRTTGGSSAGSAAAVAGGLVPIASGGDGGGSIRIPAGFNGLFGMKGTAGRIPRGPEVLIGPLTVVVGCLARSVRDAARWYDVCNGFDARDPYSLPRIEGWERDLGTHDLSGKRAVIAPNLGSAIVNPAVEEAVREAGEALAKDAGLQIVDIPVKMPGLGLEWAIANLATLLVDLGDKWPACKDDLSIEIAFGLEMAMGMMNLEMAATSERNRRAANETMADVFDQVDFVICATNPDIAYPAEVTLNTMVGDVSVGPENNGALTIPANICGNPACSIPAGTVDGLPVGLQIIGRHHEDALLLDLARIVEQERPWPLVAPDSPI
ncbi:MAG: aspartyl-tRNA(Asn)/glutamyl-tRNA(Gln) amidotransferase subunit [Acidimicrobiaceae bacterium]|jgi:aspartyl-tRNA(Asn)/glutamyl-tRNA(Gln) amidotransferase subunit A